jgi:hypothetical protein
MSLTHKKPPLLMLLFLKISFPTDNFLGFNKLHIPGIHKMPRFSKSRDFQVFYALEHVCACSTLLFTFRALWLHARGSEINVYNPDNTSYSLLISDVCYTIRQKSSIPKQKTIDCACIESTWQEASLLH